MPRTMRSSSSTSWSAACFAIGTHQRLVVRENVVGRRVEALPHLVADVPQVAQDGVAVVHLVGGRDAQARWRQRARVLDVLLLALRPRRLRRRPGVGAVLDDLRDRVAETGADVVEALAAADVLGRVVEQRRDRLVLTAAVVDDDRRRRPSGGRCRARRALAHVRGVHGVRVREGLVEACRSVAACGDAPEPYCGSE